MEREKIGLCGVPDVWGKVHEEEHPHEWVIISCVSTSADVYMDSQFMCSFVEPWKCGHFRPEAGSQ